MVASPFLKPRSSFRATPISLSSRCQNDYRPDIDGLRAVAVLAVVIFHTFPNALPGGFIGVDVFFVISGFLITRLILADLQEGKFTIRNFYARRIRRIFPALAIVLILCFAAGWIIMMPAEYERFGKHAAAGAGFVANFIFWKEAGYFDAAAYTKPLLHLWSLGVEEQFYIAWPVVMAFAWKKIRAIGWVLLPLFVISLLYSLIVVQRDQVVAFYSPFARFWELLMGAALAWYMWKSYRRTESEPARTAKPWARTVVSVIGLCLIVVTCLAIKKDSRFPGGWALLPTIGAALILWAGRDSKFNSGVLSSRPLVWVGLISYPLYLVHWPLLSFARIIESQMPSIQARIALVAFSFLISWLIYQFIEKPVRFGAFRGRAVKWLCIVLALLCAAGITIRKLDGIKLRHAQMMNADPNTLKIGADRSSLLPECGLSETDARTFQTCKRDWRASAQGIVWGDSKAEALYYGLVRESSADLRWMLIGTVVPPDTNANANDAKEKKNRLALQMILGDSRLKVVVVTNALRSLFPINDETGFIERDVSKERAARLETFGSAIRQLTLAGRQVVFVMDNPTFPDPTSCVSGGLTTVHVLNQFLFRKENPRCNIKYSDHVAGTRAYREFVAELQRTNPSILVFDTAPVLCDIGENICRMTRDDKFLYSYSDHISDFANSLLAKNLLQQIEQQKNK
jgi:peptidoglycan/LPS O-acetylase OafA/YrhL